MARVYPSNDVIVGEAPYQDDMIIGVSAGCVPGQIVAKGANDTTVIAGTGVLKPIGVLGYGDATDSYKPATNTTAYALSARAPVKSGGGFKFKNTLVIGCTVVKGEGMANWLGGQLVGPAAPAPGGIVLKIPFVKNATVADTGIDIPANVGIVDAWVEVTTAAGGATIDVGFENAVESGDLDGLLDGITCAAAGKITPVTNSTTEANLTKGVLIGPHAKDATATPIFLNIPTTYVCNGTIKSIVYTTSNHTITGFICLQLQANGLQVVGEADESKDASAAAALMWVRSLI